MRYPLLAAAALAIAPISACTTYDDDRYGYDWSRDYRAGSYEPYALGRDDEIYRGRDGRYYCKRRDGTVGLVVGAGVGGLLGNLIAPRGSNTIGTLIGAGAGAAIGSEVDRGQLRCR